MKAYATNGNAKLLRSADMFGMPGLSDVQGVLSRTDGNAAQWSLRYSTSIVQPPSNGLALLSYKTGPMPSLPNLSIDSMDFVSSSYIDMKPWFQGVNYTVDKMIDEETPGNFGDLLDSILTDPDGPKIDVRKELIYKSGPLMMQFAATRPDEAQLGKLTREKVIACALQDPVGAAKAVKAIFKDDEEVLFSAGQPITMNPYLFRLPKGNIKFCAVLPWMTSIFILQPTVLGSKGSSVRPKPRIQTVSPFGTTQCRDQKVARRLFPQGKPLSWVHG
jgi:hypothetical protein